MEEKIILYDWILDFINENYDIQYTYSDLDDMLRKFPKFSKKNYDIKKHLITMNLYPKHLTDRIFIWQDSKIPRKILIDTDCNWYHYCEKNDIDYFDQIDIFSENKPEKLKIVFDC